MKTLVIYFSHEGNTAWAARYLAEKLGADIAEIRPKRETVRKTGFMRYVWGGRQAVMKETPEILPIEKDIAKYDRIFIGTPVWAFTFAPPVRTFFKDHPIENKIVGCFCTHGGGPKQTIANMYAELGRNVFLPGIEIHSPRDFGEERAKDQMDEWICQFQ